MSYLSTKNFLEDAEFVDRWRYTLRTGELDLSWMDAATETHRVRAAERAPRPDLPRPRRAGATASPRCPELTRANRSFAPRGAEIPEGCPDLQAEVNRKSEVWAYNVEGYYEEAMSRQWNATTDMPWDELAAHELPDDIAKAYAQLLHLSHRGRDDRDRRAREVARPPECRFLRGQELHRHPGDGRGAPRRGLPQARAHDRLAA